MGHNSSSISFPNYTVNIETENGKIFPVSYHSLVEHILLLRKVIDHPEMTKEGTILNNCINDYCRRMAQGKMRTTAEQSKLPWQIEWIWHVHRLHPLHYLNDCYKQISGGVVDKQAHTLLEKHKKTNKSMMIFSSNNMSDSLFYPSIDLTSAIIRQNDFLEKFQKHFLFSYDLQQFDEFIFQHLIRDYVSFVKLSRKYQLIVPTFDIDLIWHTHMRYPSDYYKFSTAICGFILNHDDCIEQYLIIDVYQTTADRWKQSYQSEYGKNIDRKGSSTMAFPSDFGS
jgi:hypothetical protein